MYYTFQESKIWEAGDPVDPKGRQKKVKGKTEARARRKLPETSLGRTWVRIDPPTI